MRSFVRKMAGILSGRGSSSVHARQVCQVEDPHDAHRPRVKRQKSERTETAELIETVLHLGQSNGAGDIPKGVNADGRQGVKELLEDGLRVVLPDFFSSQISPLPQREEEWENNLQIQHPEDKLRGVSLGLHVLKHERGYRVHRVIDERFRENDIIREGDVIISVGETIVTEMAIEDVKSLFWNWDFDVTLQLVILREARGDQTDGLRPEAAEPVDPYRLTRVTLHLEKEDDELVIRCFVTEVRSGPYVTRRPSSQKYYIYVKEPGGTNELYLGVHDDQPTMMTMVNRNEFHWKKQITLDSTGTPLLLFLHNASNKTLCCEVDVSQDAAWAKMAPSGFLPEGTRTESDIRWIKMDLIEGDSFYMNSATHEEYFMNVSQESATMGRLRFARDTDSHPKRRIFFKPI